MSLGDEPRTLARPRPWARLLDPPTRALADDAILACSWTGRDYVIRRLLALADAAGVTLGLVAVAAASPRHSWEHLLWGLGTLPFWLVLFKAYGLYEGDVKRIQHGSLDEFPKFFHALLLGSLVQWGYFRILPPHHLVLIEVVAFAVVTILGVTALRLLVRRLMQSMLGPERVLFVGEGETIPLLLRKLSTHPEYGLAPVGLLSTGLGTDGRAAQLPVLGNLDEGALRTAVRAHAVERLIVPQDAIGPDRLLGLLHEAKELSVKVSILPQVFDALGSAVEVDEVEGVTLLGINPPVLSRSSRALKRAMDAVGAGLALVVFSPVLLCAAIAIKLESRGPVFFSQERVGRKGKRFRIVKLRTMVSDAEAQREALLEQSTDPQWLKLDHDPRITRTGRLLRHTSLDELPQLWNVLRGEMSLVGPRPLVPGEDCRVEGSARSRLDLTPGITGLWQVLGRTNIPFAEMVKLDYLYVADWTLWTDVRLLLRTLPVVLSRRGVN